MWCTRTKPIKNKEINKHEKKRDREPSEAQSEKKAKMKIQIFGTSEPFILLRMRYRAFDDSCRHCCCCLSWRWCFVWIQHLSASRWFPISLIHFQPTPKHFSSLYTFFPHLFAIFNHHRNVLTTRASFYFQFEESFGLFAVAMVECVDDATAIIAHDDSETQLSSHSFTYSLTHSF